MGAGLGLAACTQIGAEAPAPVGRAPSAIQGGAEDEVHTFAVAVIEPGGTCSGTLIAPNLVLTARHCVAGDSGGTDGVDCSRDKFFAPSAASRLSITTDKVATTKSPRYRASKVFVPSDTRFCGNDLALLMLEDNVPASAATPADPALTSALVPRKDAKVAVIGYGISGPSRSDDGTRRLRENVPILCASDDPTTTRCRSEYGITATEFVTGDGLCSGDSGGSAFDQESLAEGRPVTFGVLSRAGETSSKCIDAVFTRTDAFTELLVGAAQEAAEAGAYPLPVWAGGAPPAADAGPEAAPAPLAPGPAPAAPEGCSAAGTADPPGGAAGLVLCAALALCSRRVRVRARA